LRHEPWADVGRFAAFSRQITSLGLQPWESTVVYADTPEAHALLRRVKAACRAMSPIPSPPAKPPTAGR